MSRQRSAPSYLSAYHDGSSGDDGDDRASVEDAMEDDGDGRPKRKRAGRAARGGGAGGKRGGRGGRALSTATVARERSTRAAAVAASRVTAAAAFDLEFGDEDEYEEPAPSRPSPAAAASAAASSFGTRSARLQGQKRKTYEEPGEDDFVASSSDDEANRVQGAAPSKRGRGRAKTSKSAAAAPQYLDLNGCLGKANIDRILARKRMPAPSTHFMSTFIAQLPPERQAQLHPDDMERFVPELFKQHHAKAKEREAAAMEEQRRKAAEAQASAMDSGLGLDAGMGDAATLSLDAAATSVALSPETSSLGSFRAYVPPGADELWYLVKWRDHSYSPLSLQWMPHSLMTMFEDHAVRLRRFETIRNNGEASRAHARQSKSDEELEEDEQSTIQLALALRTHALDERAIRAQVLIKEDKIRAQQEALRAPPSSTLAHLLAEPSTDGAAASAASPAAAAASASADSSAVLTPAQIREVESRLETLRISRRLADLHNDHKLGRMKRIRFGYFDANYLGVERIIAHRRRGKTAARRNIKRFFGDTQPTHWSYYGFTPAGVHALQRSVSSYVNQANIATKRFMYELAEAIDPRVRMQRDAWEALLLRKPAPRVAAAPAAPKQEEQADEEMKHTDAQDADPAEEKASINVQPAPDLSAWMDEDDEKDQSVSQAAAAAVATTPATAVSPATAAPSPPPRRASGARSRASPPAAPAFVAEAANPSPPAVHASGRPRRAATGRRKVTEFDNDDGENGAAYVPSDDDTDLQATLRASVRDSRRTRKAAAAVVFDQFDEDQYGDGLDDEDVPAEPVAAAEVSDDDDGLFDDDDDPNASEPFEFLVKWVQLPYDHCTWETRADLRRLDEMRKPMDITRQMEGASSELNPSVPIPLLAMLPFVPLSSLLFSNNLLLKYAELPIVVSDAQHAAVLPHVSQPSAYKALHPTIPISSVQDIGPVAASSNTAVRISCISALHHYLRMHSSKTRHAAIVYPQIKGCAGAADLAAARNNAADRQSPAPFTMRAAAVDKSDRFGRNGELSLREYQLHGVNFMALNWSVGRSAILSDEMGLGKTVQSSVLLNWMVTRQYLTQPILIVAPLSTLGFWLREIERWTDLHGVIYRGSPESRKVIREWEWSWPNAASMNELDALRREEGVDINDLTVAQRLVSPVTSTTPVHRRSHKFNVLITSYEFIINDFNLLSKIKFSALVIDEAQRLKNATSKLFERLQQLKIPRRLLLTGTPIQNDLKELFALLHFIDSVQFNSESAFLDQCGSMTTLDQVTKLYHFLRPVVLRRLKSDVEKNLPNKDEILIEIQLTNMQKKYYRAIYERNFKLLANAGTAQGGAAKLAAGLRNISMQLRKVCNHPYLLDNVEREELETLQSKLPPPAILTADVVMDALVSSSGKFLLLDKLLPKLKHEGHRVLIFSQMTRILDVLSDYLNYRRYKHERLDGNVSPQERQMAIDKFSEPNSDIFAFLLSTRAGGLGITLTAADTVILFDSDWNLLNDKQAQDRAHRIGQEKDVRVFRLITKNTYEMEMFKRACQKLTLDHVIMASLSQSVSTTGGALPNVGLDAHGNRARKRTGLIGSNALDASFNETDESTALTAAAPFDKREVEEMLKHGAYGVFSASNAESDLQSIRFAEEDIDGILSRSQLVKYGDEEKGGDGTIKVELVSKADGSSGGGSGGGSGGAAKTGSTFSKASFIPAGGGEELSMSDPLFWQKLGMEDKSAPEPTTMTDAAEVLDTKRVRKPVQTFNAHADEGDLSDDSAYSDRDFSAKKSGPAVCPICEEVVKISAANPVLECARCEEQSHLSCLGLGAIPAEDVWYCPACVREMSKSKRTRPQAKEDAEDEEEYKPQKHQELAWKRAAALMENQNNNSNNRESNRPSTSAPAFTIGYQHPAKSTAPTLQMFTEQLASSTPSADDLAAQAASHRAQYDRLLGTFRITQPGKSDAVYRQMADEVWATTFKSQPPSASAAAEGTTRPPATKLSGRIHRHTSDMKTAAHATGIAPVPLLPPQFPPPQIMPPSPFQSLLRSPAHSYAQRHPPPPPPRSFGYGARQGFMSQHPLSAPPPPSTTPSLPARPKCCSAACSKLDGEPGVPSFNLCGKCRSVRYCSRACQSADWKARHKAQCAAPAHTKVEA